MPEQASQLLSEFLLLSQQMGPYLLLGFAVAGLLHVFVPETLIHRHLGSHCAGAVLRGAVFGAPLPLCSCGVIPVAASLKRGGASPPAVLSFLIATPVTGIDSILATYSLLGGFLAIVRPIASVFIAVLSGLILLLVLRKEVVAGRGGGQSKLEAATRPLFRDLPARLKGAVHYAFFELLAGIAGSVLIGLAVGAAISVFVPPSLVTGWLGRGWLVYFVMVAISTPLYVCATGSIPIAAALMAKGLSPGAAMVFLLAGPATNTVAIAVGRDLVGKRGVVVYLVTIIIGSVVAGIAVDQLAALIGASGGEAFHHHESPPGPVGIVTGYAMLGMLAYHLAAPWIRRLRTMRSSGAEAGARPDEVVLAVPSATCNRCAKAITETLTPLESVAGVTVDLDHKRVTVATSGTVSPQRLVEALRDAGYEAEHLS